MADISDNHRLAPYNVVSFNGAEIDQVPCSDIDEALSHVDRSKVNWITVRDVHDRDPLRKLLDYFHVDPSLVQEMLNESQMPFDTEYENCLYLDYIVPFQPAGDEDLIPSKGSFILGSDFLILYEHDIHGLFARTRRRILQGRTRAQRHGPDYLLYLLLRAAVVEHFQAAFKGLMLRLERVEDEVLERPGEAEVYGHILDVREAIKPWNEPLYELEDFLEYVRDAESRFIKTESEQYFAHDLFREVRDSIARYDRLRHELKEVMDLHMATVNHNANRIMQVLTVIATIFLPITFITSLYGMNVHQPEMGYRWSYPAVLLLILGIAVGSLVIMKRRHWF